MPIGKPHALLALTAAAGATLLGAAVLVTLASSAHPLASRSATIAYAVDGDTLRVRMPSGTLDYVRLIGIDTPEDVRPGYPVECGSRAAAASMRQLAPEGAAVRLRDDSIASPVDRYGRILAHAFVDGRQLEIAQLRRGWAYVYRYEGQRFDGLARFDRVQRLAREHGRGAWSSCGGDFHSAERGVQN
jgi:micrococcal nuclease